MCVNTKTFGNTVVAKGTSVKSGYTHSQMLFCSHLAIYIRPITVINYSLPKLLAVLYIILYKINLEVL